MLKAGAKIKKKREPTALHAEGFKPFAAKPIPASIPPRSRGKKRSETYSQAGKDEALRRLYSRVSAGYDGKGLTRLAETGASNAQIKQAILNCGLGSQGSHGGPGIVPISWSEHGLVIWFQVARGKRSSALSGLPLMLEIRRVFKIPTAPLGPRVNGGKKKRDSGRSKTVSRMTDGAAGKKRTPLTSPQTSWGEKLAGCTVLEGDCRELIRQIPDGVIDLVIADPPYGMGFQSQRVPKQERKGKMENDELKPSLDLLDDMLPELHRVLKPDAHVYLFCRPLLLPKLFDHLPFQDYWRWAGMICYVKGRGMGANEGSAYVPGWEAVLWFQKGKRKLNGHPSDVIWVGRTVKPHMVHPAQKDVYGLSVLVEASSHPGEVVLDFTAGSGTTGAACRMCPEIARKVILIEQDPKYAQICRERMVLYGGVDRELPKGGGMRDEG